MAVALRQAGAHDLADLLKLMHEFYAEAGYSLNPDRARAAFLPLLAPGHLGLVWLAELDGQVAGHLVLTFCYSMEYGGRSAFVDDLFVRPTLRNRGVARTLVRHARAVCEKLGVRAMHLEVSRMNGPAQTVYRAVGFDSTDRELLTLALAAPTHAA
ncbi:MAG TPA: GNAT family N-acetyltransferase [Gemmatimonadales bacterium]|jgi:GNAT superfamily N-acetyltransferase